MIISKKNIENIVLSLPPAFVRALLVILLPVLVSGEKLNAISDSYTFSYILTLALSSSISQFLIMKAESEERMALISIYVSILCLSVSATYLLLFLGFDFRPEVFFFLLFHVYFVFRCFFFIEVKKIWCSIIFEVLFALSLVSSVLAYGSFLTDGILIFFLILSLAYMAKVSLNNEAIKSGVKRVILFGLSNSMTGAIPYFIILGASSAIREGSSSAILLQTVTVCSVAIVATRYLSMDLLRSKDNFEIKIHFNNLYVRLLILSIWLLLSTPMLYLYNEKIIGAHGTEDLYIASFMLSIQMFMTMMTLPFSVLSNIKRREGSILLVNLLYFCSFMVLLYFTDGENLIEFMFHVLLLSAVRLSFCMIYGRVYLEGIIRNEI